MAFTRWRNILVNWISCFDGGTDWQLQPNDALDRIINQLRGSSLDRSASLQVQTVDDFILDKYPNFKFENGTSRPSTDEDICMAASLLLLYMCVRSKDVDMKNMMCSKLSREDQEVILKFTKCLMNRAPVTYGDVRAAVLECTSTESVAECASASAAAGTPPPLRALHGEVRRLRAALDAERFDRAYLQDELLATTGKLEKLMKDKEQHQKEIISLKAQLGERQSDLDATDPATPERESARRQFARQMSTLEERLVDTQGLLEECERARDACKSKIDEMKLDRDKWVEFGQLESGRACDLAEQLDAEKKTSSSLREMLSELHAHNRLNHRDDSSFLECDDSDSPRSRSFVRDSSVCGDVCAGVVEVQLCEERARVAALSQDLHSLQDEVKKLEDALMVKEEEILSKSDQIENELKLRGEMEATIKTFQAKQAELTDIIKFNEYQITLLRNENTEYKQRTENTIKEMYIKIQNLEEAREDLKKKIIVFENAIDQLQNENILLKDEAVETSRHLNDINDTLKKEKECLEMKVAEYENVSASNKLKMVKLQEENVQNKSIADEILQKMSHKIEELQKDNCRLEEKIIDCTNIIATNETQILKMENEIVQMKASYEGTTKRVKDELEELKTEKNSLEKKLTEYENIIISDQAQIAELQNESKNNSIEKHVILEELTGVKKAFEKNELELQHVITTEKLLIDELKNELSELKAKYQESKIQLMTDLHALNSVNDAQLEKLKPLHERLITLTEHRHTNMSNNSKADVEEKKTNKILEDSSLNVGDSQNLENLMVSQVIEKAAQTQEAIEYVVKGFQMLSSENECLRNKLTECQKNITTYISDVEYLQSETDHMKLKIQEMQEEKEAMHKESIELENVITTNLWKIGQLENQCIEMERIADDKAYSLTFTREQLKTEKETFENKLLEYDQMISNNKLGIENLQNENETLTLKCEEIVQMKASYEGTTKRVKDELEELKTEKNSLEKKLTEYENIIISDQAQIAELQNESKNNLIEKHVILEELTGVKKAFEKNELELQHVITTEKLLIDELKNELSELKAKYQESKIQLMTDLHALNSANDAQLEKLKPLHERLITLIEHRHTNMSNNSKADLEEKKTNKIPEDSSLNVGDSQNLENLMVSQVIEKAAQTQEAIEYVVKGFQMLSSENECLRNKLTECQKNITTYISDVEYLQSETDHMKLKIQEMQEEKEAMHKESIELENVITTNLWKIGQLENQCIEMERIADEKAYSLTFTREQLKTEKETFENKLLEYDQMISNNKLGIENLQNENETLTLKCEEISAEIAELKMNKISIQLEIRHLENENAQLKNKVEDISKLCDEANRLNNALTLEHNHGIKVLNDLINKVNLGNIELENKISEQCNEISNLVEENKELGNNSERIKEVLESICQSINKVLLSEDPNSVEIPFIDINEEKIENTLNVLIKNLNNFIQNSISEKSVLEKCISELKSNIKATNEEVYSIKFKLKIIISQNNGYLNTIIKDSDLFENKYGFANVTQESCNIPDANNSFEQFVTAVESILSRHKMIANVFKTELKSLSETHTQVLMDKENVSEGIRTVRKDYEKRLKNLNDQLLDKKALVSHFEKDIADMQNDKNVIINNLTDQLEKAKIENAKVSEESKVQMEELKSKLEEGNKAREDIILKKDEEYNIKANVTRKDSVEQIEALQTELREKNKALEHKLNLEKYIATLITNITDMVKLGFPDSQENVTVILPNSSENIVAVNLLRQPSVQSTTSGIVKSLCDEEKIKSLSSDEPELANLQTSIQQLLQHTTLAMKALNEANTKLEDEINKNNKLQSELLAKSSLVHSLEQDIANVELKFDDVNTEFKKIKEKDLILTELLETKESHLKASDAKLMTLETVIAEKEELVKDLNNNLITVSTERNSLKEDLHAKDDAVRQIMQQLNILMDSFESNDSATFENTVQNIEFFFKSLPNESDLKLLPLWRLKSIFSTISELKERNEILNMKCQEMELEMNSKIKILANEVAALSESIAHREDLVNDVRVTKEKDVAELQMQVHMLSTDLIGTSEERNHTISNLEKIVYDKNRTITTLQGDITYLKSLVAESEHKLLDVTRELEQCKENCQQLSAQLKRSVNMKNEEILNLKKQLSKMNSHENNASQIIKVSAKYQAIILKRIAEIKSNTVLRELSQFTNVDGDKRKIIASGTVTVDELENFLEGTEKHLRKLAERQSTLQKERDTLAEVSKINESETISLKKYLTELLAHFKTFTSVKEVYNQKLSQVISKQRMIRREIHSLDQNIPEGVMYKLERSYGIVMQDLCETALNLGRWSERCIDRSISPEKLKQAFASDTPLLSTSHFHNTGLEVQIEELMLAFKKVYEEVQKAKSMEHSKPEACNVMEVRAEYEDKLNRMKAKMKQLYHEQMSAYQSKQDAELDRLRRQLEDKSKAYEEHIQGLTRELWSVGEKLLVKKEEAEWLRRRNPSSSLMSLQHVHSSGLGPPPREGRETRREDRPDDTQSLHGVPARKPKSEGRGFHMSDEEGEVFDNRWLKELQTPPRPERDGRRATGGAGGAGGAGRISELKYRNSLCPPHLKSSYPAETHYASGAGAFNEDEIKFEGAAGGAERRGRKEVGITAYKKPGPPTPSKNAGRLSATDSELRESLRAAPETPTVRKTSTPSRLRALFRSNRSDAENTVTPRSRRLSIFRKKQ